MKNIDALIFLLFCLLLSFESMASSLKTCTLEEGPHPSKAKSYLVCLDENISSLEKIRNMWINKIYLDMENMEQETGNSQLLPIIKRSIQTQNKYIEESCRWRYIHNMPNVAKSAGEYKICKIRLLKRHIEDLKLPY